MSCIVSCLARELIFSSSLDLKQPLLNF